MFDARGDNSTGHYLPSLSEILQKCRNPQRTAISQFPGKFGRFVANVCRFMPGSRNLLTAVDLYLLLFYRHFRENILGLFDKFADKFHDFAICTFSKTARLPNGTPVASSEAAIDQTNPQLDSAKGVDELERPCLRSQIRFLPLSD
jgi:hypothetical protein